MRPAKSVSLFSGGIEVKLALHRKLLQIKSKVFGNAYRLTKRPFKNL